MQAVLESPDGELLMKELAAMWDTFGLIGNDPQETGYKVGQRDAYKFISMLRDGEMINELDRRPT
tara:strand:- start:7534 stop:7728 length:195 start_codon:yes stop_codon:yes gene_type:complete